MLRLHNKTLCKCLKENSIFITLDERRELIIENWWIKGWKKYAIIGKFNWFFFLVYFIENLMKKKKNNQERSGTN